jgi:hypothetical protein
MPAFVAGMVPYRINIRTAVVDAASKEVIMGTEV